MLLFDLVESLDRWNVGVVCNELLALRLDDLLGFCVDSAEQHFYKYGCWAAAKKLTTLGDVMSGMVLEICFISASWCICCSCGVLFIWIPANLWLSCGTLGGGTPIDTLFESSPLRLTSWALRNIEQMSIKLLGCCPPPFWLFANYGCCCGICLATGWWWLLWIISAGFAFPCFCISFSSNEWTRTQSSIGFIQWNSRFCSIQSMLKSKITKLCYLLRQKIRNLPYFLWLVQINSVTIFRWAAVSRIHVKQVAYTVFRFFAVFFTDFEES